MRNRRITAALLAACLAGTLAVPAQGEDAWQPQTVAVCEAEDGTFTGNVRVERKGSVTSFQDDGDSCTVIVQIDETGFYDLEFMVKSQGGYGGRDLGGRSMIDFEKGIVNRGNWYAIQQVFKKAGRGEPVTIGFLGGSITQGSLASCQENCYASLVFQWWQQHFPNARFINAGIGGTTSQFGVARVEADLLQYRPDMIFVEFSVNDDCNAFFMETYEGLVRKILSAGAAVMLIHNVRYDNMESAEDVHLKIGQHYALPCVSMRSTIYPLVASGRLPNRQITPDDLHPNDEGHRLVASVITYFLEIIRSASTPNCQPAGLPAPLTANQYENSVRCQNYNSQPVLEGFQPDDTPQEHITQMFRHGFTAWHAGDRITFWVEGTGIAVQYRKSVRKPAPIARVVVDNQEERAVLLDANFQEDWGDCLYIDNILVRGEQKRHKVEITVVGAHSQDAVPFYLVSVIGSR